LKEDGWRCLVLWECQLGMPAPLIRRLSKFLG
jgi:G:T-mismatch repair DNA endonuclease (very short patch repair protein)